MEKRYLGVLSEAKLAKSISPLSNYTKQMKLGSLNGLTLKRYFMSYISRLIPGVNRNWKRYVTPLGVLGILYLILKTSYVEVLPTKNLFQQIEYYLIWILGVWAGPVQRVVYYTILMLAPKIFKGFKINSIKQMLQTNLKESYNTKVAKYKDMSLKIALFGTATGLMIGTYMSGYKMVGIGGSLAIILAIWTKMSQGNSFKFMQALENDFKSKLKLKLLPKQFQTQFTLTFTIGIAGSVLFAYLSKTMWIRMIIPTIFFVVSFVLFVMEGRKAYEDEI